MMSIKKECQCPKLIPMTNILVLFNVAFGLKEMLTKCTVYSDIICPQTLLLDEIRLTPCSPQAAAVICR